MKHSGLIVNEADFRVAHGRGVLAMHAGGKWSNKRRVRTVKAPQPVNCACRFLALGTPKRSAADFLSGSFVKTG